ncbi:MAG TPA: acyl-CoA dehydrogenase family protein [Candidatus Binataceae bacterium]|nr:acyl-CoA dehydrogenase family protein [Candidatus Binataceae bacterium]
MVSFEPSDEQKMIRDTVAAFAIEEIRPAARPADESGEIPADLIGKAWELGLVRGAIPETYGGYGDTRSAVTGAIVAEELAFGDLAIALHALAPRLLAYPVLEMGTAEQRESILKRFGTDNFVAGGAALVEPRFDFDPSALATVARRDGASYVIDGAKCVVPLATKAEAILVYATANPYAGQAGVDGFIVAREAPGLTISEREKNMGIKGLETYELTLKDCRVGAEARLGGGNGINFTRLLSESRVAMAAMATGVARAAFEYARTYAKERKAFGAPIATKQAVAFMLAEMAIEIDATRLLVWEAASRLDKGEDALKESYQARNYAAQSSLMVADNAVQVLGGHGYIREHPVEMWLRNARAFAVLDGIATV